MRNIDHADQRHSPEIDLLNFVADGKAKEEQLDKRHPEKNSRRSAVTENVVKLLEHKAPETLHSLHSVSILVHQPVFSGFNGVIKVISFRGDRRGMALHFKISQ